MASYDQKTSLKAVKAFIQGGNESAKRIEKSL